jgi:hypothetical protein
MKKIIIVFLFPLWVFAQITPEFLQLKPMFTKTAQFSYTGGDQQWEVPPGVTQVFIDVFGAQGGTSTSPGAGGLGGKVRAILNVTPGEILFLMVGGQPTSRLAVYGNGGNGGTNTSNTSNQSMAGGGMSAVYRTSINMSNAIMVAGGGGGGAKGRNGGAGGGLTGLVSTDDPTRGGKGGTQSAGGAAGTSLDGQVTNPTAGQLGQGGAGGIINTNTWNSGGGGGAGYYGGGGGAGGGNYFSGGGGGSSWANSTICFKISTIPNFNSGHGKIIIYYND